MAEPLHPAATPEIAAGRRQLAPGINEAFDSVSRALFAEGALSEKTRPLIAVAVAHLSAATASPGTPSSDDRGGQVVGLPKRRAHRARG